jgi:PIN domain nuclease of toxin-antitoxin system
VAGAVQRKGLPELALLIRHTEVGSNLPIHCKSPMDRFLIAQALVEDMTIVTLDSIFANYEAKTLW